MGRWLVCGLTIFYSQTLLVAGINVTSVVSEKIGVEKNDEIA